jgi:hypothetical protein
MSYPPPGGQDPYQPPPSGPEGSNPYAQPTSPSQPAYPQPYGQQYGQQVVPAAQGNNGLSLASMITGIVSVILACCCPFLGIPGGLTAVVLGFVGLKQTRERGQAGRGMAIAGIATGAFSVVLGIIMAVLGASGVMTDWMNNLDTGSNADDDFDLD